MGEEEREEEGKEGKKEKRTMGNWPIRLTGVSSASRAMADTSLVPREDFLNEPVDA